jgi:hypothetical protein
VHVIGHHVPFEDLTLLLLRQSVEYLSKVSLQLPVQRLSATVLGGSRSRVSLMDSRICQTPAASPAERGDSHCRLGSNATRDPKVPGWLFGGVPWAQPSAHLRIDASRQIPRARTITR